MCILGEPTEGKVVLGHFGSLWVRISTQGPFIHTAFSEGKRDQNSIVRMRDVLDAVLEWIPSWEEDPENAYRGREGDRQRRRDRGRLRLAGVADAASHGPLPRRPRAADEGDGDGAVAGARDGARPRGAVPASTGSRARSTSPRRAPRSRKSTRSSARSTLRTPRSSVRRPSATSRAGSPTRPC